MKGEEEDFKFNLLNIEYVHRVLFIVFRAINLGSIYVFGLDSCSVYIDNINKYLFIEDFN
jgi:hypothetical protein